MSDGREGAKGAYYGGEEAMMPAGAWAEGGGGVGGAAGGCGVQVERRDAALVIQLGNLRDWLQEAMSRS